MFQSARKRTVHRGSDRALKTKVRGLRTLDPTESYLSVTLAHRADVRAPCRRNLRVVVRVSFSPEAPSRSVGGPWGVATLHKAVKESQNDRCRPSSGKLVHTHTCTHMRSHTRTHAHTRKHMRSHTRTHIHTRTHMRSHKHANTSAHAHTRKHMRSHTHTQHTRTHAHTCTHTHTRTQRSLHNARCISQTVISLCEPPPRETDNRSVLRFEVLLLAWSSPYCPRRESCLIWGSPAALFTLNATDTASLSEGRCVAESPRNG